MPKDDKLKDELKNLLKQNFIMSGDDEKESSGPAKEFSISEATANAFHAAESSSDNAPNPLMDVDFSKEEAKFRTKGENFIKSMYDFYLNAGLITKPEYLENKAKLDSINISNIFNQIATTKTVMKGLLGELTRGNMNPRLVESYCTLNNQLSEMIKAQANYVLFLEESYKKSRVEAIEYNNLVSEQISIAAGSNDAEAIKSLPESKKKAIDANYYITSDAKSLMDEIQSDKEMYYDDAMECRSDYLLTDSDASGLTNPMDKDSIIDRYNVDKNLLDKDEDNTSFESSVDDMI